jgi:hypothetical protein
VYPSFLHKILISPSHGWHTESVIIGRSNNLTKEARFFLEPEKPAHRQYEALRAFFAEGLGSAEVAERFGYTAGSFRVLCHGFRHAQELRERFFSDLRPGPRCAPLRNRVRELTVAMRKKNMSVYDIQRELSAAKHEVSINSLSILLREEGFVRLPRRTDDERPETIKPEAVAAADVRELSLSPRDTRGRTLPVRSADAQA